MADASAIEQFIEKYQIARNYNSKELRFTIQEAETLSMALTVLLSREMSLSNRVIELQQQLLDGIELSQDGGKF